MAISVTIEEQIRELHSTKRDLADSVLSVADRPTLDVDKLMRLLDEQLCALCQVHRNNLKYNTAPACAPKLFQKLSSTSNNQDSSEDISQRVTGFSPSAITTHKVQWKVVR